MFFFFRFCVGFVAPPPAVKKSRGRSAAVESQRRGEAKRSPGTSAQTLSWRAVGGSIPSGDDTGELKEGSWVRWGIAVAVCP